MLSRSLSFTLVGVAILLTAAPAFAQFPVHHTWVSANGSGAACTRAAPCSSFQTAINATLNGGVISVLDSGDFGSLTIDKPLTLRAEGVDGGQVVTGGGGSMILVFAGPSDTVRIEGLHFAGSGINIFSGGTIHIRNTVVGSNDGAPPSAGFGILFQPNTASRLVITDTAVINNGTNPSGAGILIKPRSGGSAQVHLERVSAQGNVFGVAADGSGSTAGINMTISDSVASGNRQDGFLATTPGGGAAIGVLVSNSRSTNNAIGIRSLGPNVTVRVKNSDIAGNGTGVSFGLGGALLSAGNNIVEANGTNGAFSGGISFK